MAPDRLDERKRRILKVVTDDYIASAEPVGSRTIARKYDLGLSPATIRNEMADLEEEGYLQQPHTSAGRIPSDRGYRYYVDALMERRRLRPEEMSAIKRELDARECAINTLIHQAVRVLAQFTHFPSLISSPETRKALFQHIRLIPMNDRRILVILVTDTGQVEHRMLDGHFDMGEKELERLSNAMNQLLYRSPLTQLKANLEQELKQRVLGGEKLFHQALQALIEGMPVDGSEQMIMDGAVQILDQPEFTDRERFRPLLNLLEQEEALYHLFTETAGPNRLKVSIGQENRERAMQDCSVVTATYEMRGRAMGIIGVLGPTRMDYARVMAAVEFMAAHLSLILNDLAGR